MRVLVQKLAGAKLNKNGVVFRSGNANEARGGVFGALSNFFCRLFHKKSNANNKSDLSNKQNISIEA